jgi:thymidylate kinase
MLADQYSQVGQIQDCLRRGGIVVADRWTPSGQVYGTLEGLDRNWILDAQNSLPIADVHFLLDVDVDVICARLASRGSTRGIYEVEAFQQRVVSLYRTIWSTNAQGSGKRWTRNMWRRVDATRDEPIIHEELFAIVSRMNWNG